MAKARGNSFCHRHWENMVLIHYHEFMLLAFILTCENAKLFVMAGEKCKNIWLKLAVHQWHYTHIWLSKQHRDSGSRHVVIMLVILCEHLTTCQVIWCSCYLTDCICWTCVCPFPISWCSLQFGCMISGKKQPRSTEKWFPFTCVLCSDWS